MTAAELKQAQLALGLTNTALAARLGVSLSAVEKWRAGTRPISRPVAIAIGTLKPP